MKWTKDHKAMLFSPMTNEEIAEETGRKCSAVRKMRSYYTGHAVERGKWRPLRTDKDAMGVSHVIATAKRIGAKILDVR